MNDFAIWVGNGGSSVKKEFQSGGFLPMYGLSNPFPLIIKDIEFIKINTASHSLTR